MRIFEQVQRIAMVSAILIRGERGTGKDLLSSVIHHLGRNPDSPLITVDCAAVFPDILESELFGVERSGFVQRGRVELAHGGTLVLNEIAALPLAAQERLLRVIEDRKFERMGGTRSVTVEVRVIATSTADIEVAVERKEMLQELVYALGVHTMMLPPLRARRLDIRPLAERFLNLATALHRKPQRSLTPGAMAALESYSYPGNVAELRQVIEHAVVNGNATEIQLQDLPAHVRECAVATIGNMRSLEDVEREYITRVLQFTNGRKTDAANILGISRKTLLEKRKRYGLG